ncbi:MAG: SUMF1/EgtB/PvdO family nonheme iron enzyme [Sphingobacteriales bacterium]|jgi:sulfatase modifying factor 1|nr:SUMF1/EgtB/PvdO family nonheme iron enzyme [Sphingobacteriales bacterium]
MNKFRFSLIAVIAVLLASCKSSGTDGQLIGAQDRPKWDNNLLPYGMIYVPSGVFHAGPSDQDVNYAFNTKMMQMSIVGFYMDETEITNNEYRQFVEYVRDSIAHQMLGGDHLKEGENGKQAINWDMPIDMDWQTGSSVTEEGSQLEPMFYSDADRINGVKEVDPRKLMYEYTWFKWKEAAQRENMNKPRSQFMEKKKISIYPDEMVWIRDFSYSYNEPMTRTYFTHPAYDDYPVVGVTWDQCNAFCAWRTIMWNNFRLSKKEAPLDQFRLPTEYEWEYAARGGRNLSPYPWGGPYIRNTKGCLLANFKPGRGNYPEDGGFYTVNAKSYWPNDYGLYNMAGNIAEWTSTAYEDDAVAFIHDKQPDFRYDAKEDEPNVMKRKVIRGGSWKDIAYFLQCGTKSYEYQDSAKSYIGFRCLLPFMGRAMNDFGN